jgi:hypothetical protein
MTPPDDARTRKIRGVGNPGSLKTTDTTSGPTQDNRGRKQGHPDEQCRDCGDPAERTLGAVALCHECADKILDPIRARVIEAATLDGAGHQCGAMRPDFGRHAADLQCRSCRAGWVGIPGEPCQWCEHRWEAALVEQHEIVLAPALPEPTDARFEIAAVAWAERLGVAVRAGIVTEAEALSAREVVADVAA